MKNNKGFTLIEIISVVTIIVMLAVIIVPIIDKNIKDAQNFATAAQVDYIENAAIIYAENNRSSITGLEENSVATIPLQELIDEGILEEKKLIASDGDPIDPYDVVVIAIIDEEIRAAYSDNLTGANVIFLHGPKKMTLPVNTSYVEPGASISQIFSSTVSNLDSSYITSNVNTAVPGTYTVTYEYTDATTLTRTVVVSSSSTAVDNEKPVITINGSSTITITKGTTYTDAGAAATDNKDGTITSRIVTSGSVNINQKGTYYIKYNVTDFAGNKANTVTRTVTVN